jgi:hypothetical protein
MADARYMTKGVRYTAFDLGGKKMAEEHCRQQAEQKGDPENFDHVRGLQFVVRKPDCALPSLAE